MIGLSHGHDNPLLDTMVTRLYASKRVMYFQADIAQIPRSQLPGYGETPDGKGNQVDFPTSALSLNTQ